MGQGDEICLIDANFPAELVAGSLPLIRLDGVSMRQMLNAAFLVLPLDSFVEPPMVRMEMVGQPQQMPEVQVEVLALARLHHDAGLTMGSLKHFAFYEAARQAFVIVATGDRRPMAVS